MIDVNMLPRELTGYVGHVCGLWFGSYFIDFEPVFVHSTAASSVNCTNTWWIRFRTIR